MELFLSDPQNVLVLDGALGTELEKRGCDVQDPIWSGKILLEAPQRIREVELAYLEAGARCIITSSYQITPTSLMEHRGLTLEASMELIAESVSVAAGAKVNYLSRFPDAGPVFIAGSVGPYGAYLADGSEYTGRYLCTEAQLESFHRPRIEALVNAGVDILAIETQPSAAEVFCILRLLERDYPKVLAWVSFTLSATEPSLTVADGTHFADIIPLLDAAPQVIAIGVNCVALSVASSALQGIGAHTRKPLVVYPNSGEIYDGITKTWSLPPRVDGQPCESTLAGLAKEWRRLGARLIGGCCRTGPQDIEHLCASLRAG